MRHLRATLCFLLLIAIIAGCYKPESESHPLGSEENPVVMAFVPSTEAEKVIDSAGELTSLLTEKTGIHFKPQLSTSYVGIVEAMAVGKVHVAWLPPLAYVYAHDRNGDEAILKVVRDGKATYRGQIVVMADSGIEEMTELKGKRLAFTDQTSASGHYYPAVLLKEAGISPDDDLELIYAGGHDAAVLALVKGSVDAACCYDDARGKLKDMGFPDIEETTRILAYTPDIPADNVAVIDGLDAELIEKIKTGLLDLASSETGKQVLFDLYEVEGLVSASDADYTPVRQMVAAMDMDIEEQVAQGN
jgi:phosphonate transport system substrate-binding protein